MEPLATAITNIGREMVSCGLSCAGIHRDQRIGSLPRCLVLETSGRPSSAGSAIVGINPGRATQKERDFYLARGGSYDAVVEWFKIVGVRHRYYTGLRKLVDQIGLSGPILWSELAKCENAPLATGLLPLQTLRRCSGLYLQRELAAIPPSWPIFAVGGEAFRALAYLHPERIVIGAPHPTGAYGHFARLFDAGSLKAAVRAQFEEAVSSSLPDVVWLESRPAARRRLT